MKRLLVVLLLWPALAFADTGSSGAGDTLTPEAAKVARKACSDAMSSDPTFASDIVKRAATTKPLAEDAIAALKTAGVEIKTDVDVKAVHEASDQAAQNSLHVILAYAAMWLAAAAFVIFLWFRQMGLKAEIATLRNDLARQVSADQNEKVTGERSKPTP